MLNGIKSKYVITYFIIPHLQRGKFLNLIKYSKKLKEIVNINIEDYKNYSKIIIELTKTRMHYVTELL